MQGPRYITNITCDTVTSVVTVRFGMFLTSRIFQAAAVLSSGDGAPASSFPFELSNHIACNKLIVSYYYSIGTHAVQSIRVGSEDNTIFLDVTFLKNTTSAGAMIVFYWAQHSRYVYTAVSKDVVLGGFGLGLSGVYDGGATVWAYDLDKTGKLTPGESLQPAVTLEAFVNGISKMFLFAS